MERLPYADVSFECFIRGKRLYTYFTQVAMMYERDVLDKTSFQVLLLLPFWFWFFETNQRRFFHCQEVSRSLESKKESRKTLLGAPMDPQNPKKDGQLKYDYIWGYLDPPWMPLGIPWIPIHFRSRSRSNPKVGTPTSHNFRHILPDSAIFTLHILVTICQ